MAIRELLPHLPEILKNRNGPAPAEQVGSSQPLNGPGAAQNQDNNIVPKKKDGEKMDPKDFEGVKEQIKKKLDQNMRAAIRNNDLTLDQLKENVKGWLQSKGYTQDIVPMELLEVVYNEVKNETVKSQDKQQVHREDNKGKPTENKQQATTTENKEKRD